MRSRVSTRIGRVSITVFDAILTLRSESQCLLRPNCTLPDPSYLLELTSPRCDSRTECWVRSLRRYTAPDSPDGYEYLPPTPLLDLLMEWSTIVGIQEDYTSTRRGQGRANASSSRPGPRQGRATHHTHHEGGARHDLRATHVKRKHDEDDCHQPRTSQRRS